MKEEAYLAVATGLLNGGEDGCAVKVNMVFTYQSSAQ
jgi:hypothetical protein